MLLVHCSCSLCDSQLLIPQVDIFNLSLRQPSQAARILLFKTTAFLEAPSSALLLRAVLCAENPHLKPIGNRSIQLPNLSHAVAEDVDSLARRQLGLHANKH